MCGGHMLVRWFKFGLGVEVILLVQYWRGFETLRERERERRRHQFMSNVDIAIYVIAEQVCSIDYWAI
jgi:hypothetical protein